MAPALEPLFRSLSDDINAGQYKKASEVCDKILAEAPNDQDALKCKCLCLIHLNQFNDALQFLQQHLELQKEMNTERAYCFYKERRYQDALSVIEDIKDLTPSIAHLKAQIYYRIGNYQSALDCYEKMEQSTEVLVNIAAVNTSRGVFNDLMKKILNDEQLLNSSYELCFNIGCLLIHRGDLSSAEKLISQAERVCNVTLSAQDYNESEILDELAAVRVQLGYIYQTTNRSDQAVELYEKVLANKPSEVAVVAVANNNLAFANKNQKLFNMERNLFNAASVDQRKLLGYQQKTIIFNRAVVYLKMGKADKCKEMIDQLRQSFPESSLSILLESALLFKEKQIADAEKLLKSNSTNVQAQLCLAQVLLKDGNIEKCLEVLKNLSGDLSYRPGVVATRVKLFLQLNQPENAHKTLDDAVNFWSDKDPQTCVTILSAAANFKLQQQQYQTACDYFTRLIKLDPENKQVYIPKLVISMSYFDPSAAKQQAQVLPEIQYNAAEINVEELENAGRFRSQKQSLISEGEDVKAVERKKKKSKKKKKKRLPKKYDPNVQPDPERWLPRHERTNVKKRREKKMKGRHQGVDTGPETQPAATQSPNQPTAQTKQPAASQQSKPAQPQPQPQRKKGKGRRR